MMCVGMRMAKEKLENLARYLEISNKRCMNHSNTACVEEKTNCCKTGHLSVSVLLL
jgi:hypothetical protein